MENYVIYGKLATGRHSTVFKARRKGTLCFFAVKQSEAGSEAHFLQQVSLLLSLPPHKTVLSFDGWYLSPSHVYRVFEYAGGGMSLHALARHDGGVPEASLRLFGVEVVQAVLHLHTRSVLVCNLTAKSIILTEDGTCKLSRLDAARRAGGDLRWVDGTPTSVYSAPELLVQGGSYSRATDLWALGVLLHVLATGRVPFAHKRKARADVEAGFREALDRPTLPDSLSCPPPHGHSALRRSGVAAGLGGRPANSRIAEEGGDGGEEDDEDGEAGHSGAAHGAYPRVPASDALFHLLSRLLEREPARRCSWDELLRHPWWSLDAVRGTPNDLPPPSAALDLPAEPDPAPAVGERTMREWSGSASTADALEISGGCSKSCGAAEESGGALPLPALQEEPGSSVEAHIGSASPPQLHQSTRCSLPLRYSGIGRAVEPRDGESDELGLPPSALTRRSVCSAWSMGVAQKLPSLVGVVEATSVPAAQVGEMESEAEAGGSSSTAFAGKEGGIAANGSPLLGAQPHTRLPSLPMPPSELEAIALDPCHLDVLPVADADCPAVLRACEDALRVEAVQQGADEADVQRVIAAARQSAAASLLAAAGQGVRPFLSLLQALLVQGCGALEAGSAEAERVSSSSLSHPCVRDGWWTQGGGMSSAFATPRGSPSASRRGSTGADGAGAPTTSAPHTQVDGDALCLQSQRISNHAVQLLALRWLLGVCDGSQPLGDGVHGDTPPPPCNAALNSSLSSVLLQLCARSSSSSVQVAAAVALGYILQRSTVLMPAVVYGTSADKGPGLLLALAGCCLAQSPTSTFGCRHGDDSCPERVGSSSPAPPQVVAAMAGAMHSRVSPVARPLVACALGEVLFLLSTHIQLEAEAEAAGQAASPSTPRRGQFYVPEWLPDFLYFTLAPPCPCSASGARCGEDGGERDTSRGETSGAAEVTLALCIALGNVASVAPAALAGLGGADLPCVLLRALQALLVARDAQDEGRPSEEDDTSSTMQAVARAAQLCALPFLYAGADGDGGGRALGAVQSGAEAAFAAAVRVRTTARPTRADAEDAALDDVLARLTSILLPLLCAGSLPAHERTVLQVSAAQLYQQHSRRPHVPGCKGLSPWVSALLCATLQSCVTSWDVESASTACTLLEQLGGRDGGHAGVLAQEDLLGEKETGRILAELQEQAQAGETDDTVHSMSSTSKAATTPFPLPTRSPVTLGGTLHEARASTLHALEGPSAQVYTRAATHALAGAVGRVILRCLQDLRTEGVPPAPCTVARLLRAAMRATDSLSSGTHVGTIFTRCTALCLGACLSSTSPEAPLVEATDSGAREVQDALRSLADRVAAAIDELGDDVEGTLSATTVLLRSFHAPAGEAYSTEVAAQRAAIQGVAEHVLPSLLARVQACCTYAALQLGAASSDSAGPSPSRPVSLVVSPVWPWLHTLYMHCTIPLILAASAGAGVGRDTQREGNEHPDGAPAPAAWLAASAAGGAVRALCSLFTAAHARAQQDEARGVAAHDAVPLLCSTLLDVLKVVLLRVPASDASIREHLTRRVLIGTGLDLDDDLRTLDGLCGVIRTALVPRAPPLCDEEEEGEGGGRALAPLPFARDVQAAAELLSAVLSVSDTCVLTSSPSQTEVGDGAGGTLGSASSPALWGQVRLPLWVHLVRTHCVEGALVVGLSTACLTSPRMDGQGASALSAVLVAAAALVSAAARTVKTLASGVVWRAQGEEDVEGSASVLALISSTPHVRAEDVDALESLPPLDASWSLLHAHGEGLGHSPHHPQAADVLAAYGRVVDAAAALLPACAAVLAGVSGEAACTSPLLASAAAVVGVLSRAAPIKAAYACLVWSDTSAQLAEAVATALQSDTTGDDGGEREAGGGRHTLSMEGQPFFFCPSPAFDTPPVAALASHVLAALHKGEEEEEAKAGQGRAQTGPWATPTLCLLDSLVLLMEDSDDVRVELEEGGAVEGGPCVAAALVEALGRERDRAGERREGGAARMPRASAPRVVRVGRKRR